MGSFCRGGRGVFLGGGTPLIYINDCLDRVAPEGLCSAEPVRAVTPPRGWNSYDSFCWTISEEEFLQNAELVSQRLRDHGYEVYIFLHLDFKIPDSSCSFPVSSHLRN